ncbi:hypothetical protein P8452_25196 [Trifolium repens]|nr:hypothetical protein P8452_25196 [Trifolium repens]
MFGLWSEIFWLNNYSASPYGNCGNKEMLVFSRDDSLTLLKTSVLFAATKCEDNEVSPLIAENMGLCWYLMRADHRHLRNLIIVMDVETIVKCVYGIAKPAAIANIVFDCS